MPDFLHVVRDVLTPAPAPAPDPETGGELFYVYTQGEQHVPGEGTYRAGDVRWARAGHVDGPEVAGPDGVTLWVLTHGNPLPVPADE